MAIAVEQARRPRARTADRSFMVPVSRVRPNPRHARSRFDELALEDLADSLRQWGQLQPVVVRRIGDSGEYELVCGERRWLAHQRAGLDMLWAVEWDATDQEALVLGLIENVQRVNLSHAEKVAALDQLAELSNVHGLRRTARQLRVDPSWLSRQLAVRRDPLIFRAFEAGQIGVGQATELLRAPAQMREFLLHRVVRSADHVSSTTVRAWVDAVRGRGRPGERGRGCAGAYRAVIDDVKQLPTPSTDEDRAAMFDLLAAVQDLVQRSTVTEWVELTCLMCGEQGRAQRIGARLRLVGKGDLRQSGDRLVCGRCGGAVAPGDCARQYHY